MKSIVFFPVLATKTSWKCNKHCWDDRLHCHILLTPLLHCQCVHVGDSTAVMGIKNSHYGKLGKLPILAKVLTIEQKPEDPLEQKQVKSIPNSRQSWPPSYTCTCTPTTPTSSQYHKYCTCITQEEDWKLIACAKLVAYVLFNAGYTCLEMASTLNW